MQKLYLSTIQLCTVAPTNLGWQQTPRLTPAKRAKEFLDHQLLTITDIPQQEQSLIIELLQHQVRSHCLTDWLLQPEVQGNQQGAQVGLEIIQWLAMALGGSLPKTCMLTIERQNTETEWISPKASTSQLIWKVAQFWKRAKDISEQVIKSNELFTLGFYNNKLSYHGVLSRIYSCWLRCGVEGPWDSPLFTRTALILILVHLLYQPTTPWHFHFNTLLKKLKGFYMIPVLLMILILILMIMIIH